MSQELIKTLKARFEYLVNDRKVAEEDWDLIERFIYPIGGGKFFRDERSEQSKDWRRREVFDDTAIMGADMLASSIHSALTPATSRWFDIVYNTTELKDDQEAIKWLQDAVERTWIEIQSSNFDLEVGETYLDLTAFGNGVLFEEENPKVKGQWSGVNFASIPLKEAYFELDHLGQVSRFYRFIQWTPLQIVSKFPDAPQSIKELADKGDTTRIDVVFAIYKNEEAKEYVQGTEVAIAKRPFNFTYFLRDSTEQLGELGGYYEMPVFFPRYRRTTGSVWGYGAGHLALPTVLTLNEYKKMVLAAGEKAIDPPMMARKRGVIGNIHIQAGDVTVVDDIDKAMKPLDSAARFDVSAMSIEQLQSAVRNLFRMNQLELQDGPQMTATEVEVRYELMHRLLGPTQGRITNDMLDKVVSRTFNMLFRAGVFGEMPESLLKSQVGIDIEYLAPLARAQKMDKVTSLQRWMGGAAELSQVYPDAAKVPKAAESIQYMAKTLGLPADLYNNSEEVNYITQLERQIEVLTQRMEEMINAQQQQPAGEQPPQQGQPQGAGGQAPTQNPPSV